MPTSTATRKKRFVGLSDEELQELTRTIGGSNSVELKLSVPETQHRSTVTALGLDPLAAQIRQVYFFDTPDLALDSHGLIVRARRLQGRGDDSVVQLRPVEPHALPDHLGQWPGTVVEVDAMPGSWICSASSKGTRGAANVSRVVAGRGAIRKLFSKEQRAFYRAHAPEGLDLDDLAVLGPIFVLKLNLRPADYGRKLVAEMWLYPNGSRILELSTKCLPAEMPSVAVATRAFLADRGIAVTSAQRTKTRAALTYFSKHLADGEHDASVASA